MKSGMPVGRRSIRFSWIIAEGLIVFTLIAATGLAFLVAAITLGIAWRSTISESVWAYASNAVPWYAGAIAGYIFFQMVPMLIANGRTRRDALRDGLGAVSMLAAAIAILNILFYAVEGMIYRAEGWPMEIADGHLFSRHGQMGLIALESLLTTAVWSAVGAFVALAMYRDREGGYLALVPAVVILLGSGVFVSIRIGAIDAVLDRLRPAWVSSWPGTIMTAAIGMVLSIVLLIRIMKDMPLRPWR